MQSNVERLSSARASLKRELLMFVLNLIYTISFNALLLHSLNSSLSFLELSLYTIISALLMTIAFYNWQTTVGSSVLLGVSFLILYYTPLSESFLPWLDELIIKFQNVAVVWTNFMNEGLPYLTKSVSSPEAEAQRFFSFLIIIIVAIITYFVIQKRSNSLITWTMTILLMTFAIMIGPGNHILWLVPLVLIPIFLTLLSSGNMLNLLNFKNAHKHMGKASAQLAIILALAVLASALLGNRLDHSNIYSPYWQGIMDDILTVFPESFQSVLTVNTYSIRDDGYYPLGNRLGGPVTLEDREVGELNGSVPSLLKVQSSDSYDGAMWRRTVNNPNYRYNSPFNAGAETNVFNPPADQDFFNAVSINSDSIFENYTYSFRPMVNRTQFVFVTGTPYDLVSSREEALLFYFNQAGSVYAKDAFNNDHAYEVSTYVPEANNIGLNGGNSGRLAAFDRAAASVDETTQLRNAANAYENYLQIPELATYAENGRMFDLALSITEGIEGEYAKVNELLSYFKNNDDFSYSLDVSVPPEDVDFVEYFIDTMIGYCTYYASAMTMIARLNGIPARYVEGYSLPSEQIADLRSGETVGLNSENAHAWTEVYLSGIGWVAVDPTPAEYNEPVPEATPTPTPPPTTTTTTTSPTTTTSDELEPTTTTTTTEPTTTPDTTEDERDWSGLWRALGTILLVLLLFGLLLLAAWLYYSKRKEYIENLHDRAYMAEKIPDKKKRVDFYWRELLALQKIIADFSPAGSMTELEIGKLLESQVEAMESGLSVDSVGTVDAVDSGDAVDAVDTVDSGDAVDADGADEIVDSEDAVKTVDSGDAIDKLSDNVEAPTTDVVETTDIVEKSTSINWREVTRIVAESRYSQFGTSDAKIEIIAESFDTLEDLVKSELNEINYTIKRILPLNQGKM